MIASTLCWYCGPSCSPLDVRTATIVRLAVSCDVASKWYIFAARRPWRSDAIWFWKSQIGVTLVMVLLAAGVSGAASAQPTGDLVFAPEVETMYPPGFDTRIDSCVQTLPIT